jgi:hypothetical protein
MPSSSWLLFLYKVPRKPSSHRVYIWRRLKKFGAIRLQDTAWALPMTTHNLSQFQWLKAEVEKLGGNSFVWEAHLAIGEQGDAPIRAFSEWPAEVLTSVK